MESSKDTSSLSRHSQDSFSSHKPDSFSSHKSDSSLSHSLKVSLTPSASTTHKKSRSEMELSRCFENANTESLLKQYSCAWHNNNILVQGHMYITCHHVCFYSNLFWETKLAIKFKDITRIMKQKTALVVPNAITVTTPEKEYFFTSFLHRNNAYTVLQSVWKYSVKGISLTREDLLLLKNGKNHLVDKDTDEEGTESVDTVDDDIEVDGIKSRSHRIPQTSSESTLSDDLNIRCSGYSSQHTEQSDDTVTEAESTSNGLTEYVEEEISGMRGRSGSTRNIDVFGSVVEGSEQRGVTWRRYSWQRLKGYILNRNMPTIAGLINIIIILLISILLVSMLTLICKLSELDPNLRPWLSWQPWCRFVCKSSSFVSVNVVSSHDSSHDSSMF